MVATEHRYAHFGRGVSNRHTVVEKEVTIEKGISDRNGIGVAWGDQISARCKVLATSEQRRE